MQMEPAHVAVAPFLNEVVEMCRPLADKNGNTLTMTIADAITSVVADPMRLRQSLFNLLSNACKFTHQGTISLRADRDGEWLRLAVRDSGIGIAPEHLSKLFTNFTQASSGIAVRYGGTGLGLALSQRLCQLMGGRIEADSVLGEGSCFTIHLPLEPAAGSARLAA
jgi:signal transduction histidine kinase